MSTATVVGIDPHLDTLAAAVIDQTGRVLWEGTMPNTDSGIAELLAVTGEWAPGVWAIEGAGSWGRHLAAKICADGGQVREVPTRLTGRLRRREGPGKTDRADARTIARAALHTQLPQPQRPPLTEALRILTTQREALIHQQVQAANRTRAHLGELNPEHTATLPRIRGLHIWQQLNRQQFPATTSPYQQALVETIRQDARQAIQRHHEIRHLNHQIHQLIPPAGQALMNIPGIGPVGAATILAHTGDIRRFPTHHHYASWCGTAPLDATSGRQQRHRLNRHGNRTINRTLHTAIITQLARNGPAAHYITKRLAEGKTKTEAIRAAKRHLTRHVYNTLKNHPLT
jgi:transposase